MCVHAGTSTQVPRAREMHAALIVTVPPAPLPVALPGWPLCCTGSLGAPRNKGMPFPKHSGSRCPAPNPGSLSLAKRIQTVLVRRLQQVSPQGSSLGQRPCPGKPFLKSVLPELPDGRTHHPAPSYQHSSHGPLSPFPSPLFWIKQSCAHTVITSDKKKQMPQSLSFQKKHAHTHTSLF